MRATIHICIIDTFWRTLTHLGTQLCPVDYVLMMTASRTPHVLRYRPSLIQLVGVLAVLLALVGAVLVVIGQIRLAVIMTGSMAPVWSTGALVLLWRTTGASLHPGELIGFTPPSPFPHALVVHRIFIIGQHSVILTKGDANTTVDPWRLTVHDQFFSVIGHWNYLGTVIHDVTQPVGWISIGLLVVGSLLQFPPLHRRQHRNN